jgi:hypothetical protein
MTKPNLPAAPPHLSPEARGWWDRFVAGWRLDDAALLVLQTALEAFDRMRAATAVLEAQGLVTAKGTAHPLVTVERDSRLALLRALRSLHLDVEPVLAGAGRPPGR